MKRLLLALLLLPSLAWSLPLTFTCDPNSPEEQVVEYRLYLTAGTGTPVQIASAPVPPWPSVNIAPAGGLKVTATAVNLWGIESAHSVPVVLPPLPAAPKNVRR